MVHIRGITKKTFMDSTRAALAAVSGQEIPLHVLRKFVATQFHLNNEHLIESMFVEAAKSQTTPLSMPAQSSAVDWDKLMEPSLSVALDSLYVLMDEHGRIAQWCDGADREWAALPELSWEGLWLCSDLNTCKSMLVELGKGQIVRLPDAPELWACLWQAMKFSLLPMPQAERMKKSLLHVFGVTKKSHEKEAPLLSEAMYTAQCFRTLFHSCLTADKYPIPLGWPSRAVLYIPDVPYSVDVAGISIEQRLAMWAVWQIGGLASHAIMAHMTGLGPELSYHAPDDASSWLLCVILLQCFPEWRLRLPEMARYSGWAHYVAHWTEWEHELLKSVSLPLLLSGEVEMPASVAQHFKSNAKRFL